MGLNFPKCSLLMEPLCLLHSLPSHTHTVKVIVSHRAAEALKLQQGHVEHQY